MAVELDAGGGTKILVPLTGGGTVPTLDDGGGTTIFVLLTGGGTITTLDDGGGTTIFVLLTGGGTITTLDDGGGTTPTLDEGGRTGLVVGTFGLVVGGTAKVGFVRTRPDVGVGAVRMEVGLLEEAGESKNVLI